MELFGSGVAETEGLMIVTDCMHSPAGESAIIYVIYFS